ncbi:UNVERIFIED_CONTAM: hypothetical protein RMT77_018825 [Armadillidium vulgare]
MDKYVIKTSRPVGHPSKNESSKNLRQAKIHNLKGVVVIEDMERAKLLLERKDVEPQVKINTLETLSKKCPSKEVLINTKLGKTVHKLCRDSNIDVANHAKTVYQLWRNNIVSKIDKPMIEVRCDLQTQKLREIARDLIYNSLAELLEKSEKNKNSSVGSPSNSDVDSVGSPYNSEAENDSDYSVENLKNLAEYIESEVFKEAKKKISNQYRRTNRKIVFVLKYQKDIKINLIKGKISVPKFVETYFQK